MVTLAVVVLVGVGFRKAGMALAWYDEIASVLLAWLTYYGSALAALNRRHIGFGKAIARLDPGPLRVARSARRALVVAFWLVVAWSGARVVQVLAGTYLVGLPWMPVAVTQSVVPVGALLFVAAELLDEDAPFDHGGAS